MRNCLVALLLIALVGCGTPAAPVEPSASSPAPASSVASPSPTPIPSQPTPSEPAPSTPEPAPSPTEPPVTEIAGVDVSGWQPNPDWDQIAAAGHQFAFIKATEGTGYLSPVFAAQWADARARGLLTGAYHYARPASSSGAEQASYLVANGGGWTADGLTLPAALDIEDAESGDVCHGLDQASFAGWVRSFVDQYQALTGRTPIIYVKQVTWDRCVGSAEFGDLALWLYDHEAPMGPLPLGWESATFWQYGVVDGLDRNLFFGDLTGLQTFATG